MADDPHSRGGPPTYTQPGARQPSHAERTRTLLAGSTDGTLSTIALEPAGFPFGSIVTFATDQAGAPLILMSTMAEHARNLAEDPRASLLVTAAGEGAGRLAAARATLVGTINPVSEQDQAPTTEAYLTAHPGAFWARFPDFSVHRLAVTAIRYVRGFGEMSWADVTAYGTAEPDPVAPVEAQVLQHMNDDHAAALSDMVAAFLDVAGTVTAATMLSCDRYGFEVQLAVTDDPDGNEMAFGRLGFLEPLVEAAQARSAMVALTRAAR
ncbi:MAG: HugZ family protein [Euzebya sp.]